MLSGALNESNKGALRLLALEALAAGQTDLWIDFVNCPIVDSFGLSALVSLSKRIAELYGRVTLVHLSSELE
jgi:anti-anti-sigma regulatory factor